MEELSYSSASCCVRRLASHNFMAIAHDCSTSRQAGTANSGGKPPHSKYAVAAGDRRSWSACCQGCATGSGLLRQHPAGVAEFR